MRREVYVESSAILCWLLDHDFGTHVGRTLRDAKGVVSSKLTIAEVGRTLRRLSSTVPAFTVEVAEKHWIAFSAVAAHWKTYSVTDEVLARVGERFPSASTRTLDAIHLATASLHSHRVRPVVVLSLHNEIRKNALGMGMRVLPNSWPPSR